MSNTCNLLKAHSALAVDGLIVKEESLAKSGVYLQDIGIKVNTVHSSEMRTMFLPVKCLTTDRTTYTFLFKTPPNCDVR